MLHLNTKAWINAQFKKDMTPKSIVEIMNQITMFQNKEILWNQNPYFLACLCLNENDEMLINTTSFTKAKPFYMLIDEDAKTKTLKACLLYIDKNDPLQLLNDAYFSDLKDLIDLSTLAPSYVILQNDQFEIVPLSNNEFQQYQQTYMQWQQRMNLSFCQALTKLLF